jgi:succinate dehydrogenase/fumarate reductase flavoprotein subunit
MREIRLVRGVEKELPKKEAEVQKGELKKQEAPAKKLDARMEKIEKRTDHLLNKAQSQEAKKLERIEDLNHSVSPKNHEKITESITQAYVEHSQSVAEPYVKRSLIKRRASYIEFLCMKGIKKQILLSIKENAFQEDGLWQSILNTDDIEQRTGSKASIIRDAIYRMKEEGWFEIIHSSNSGSRLLKIYPEHFKI